jgi:hypothetical protein
MYNSGMSSGEIAERFGAASGTVEKALWKLSRQGKVFIRTQREADALARSRGRKQGPVQDVVLPVLHTRVNGSLLEHLGELLAGLGVQCTGLPLPDDSGKEEGEAPPPRKDYWNTAAGFVGDHKARLGQPTEALPGTMDKMAVMHLRAQLGQPLFHPDDATLEDYCPADDANRESGGNDAEDVAGDVEEDTAEEIR